MSLRGSAQMAASQFTVPLDRLVDLRVELERRARAADIAGQNAVCTSHQFAIKSLSEMISATRAAGKQDRDRNTVLDRAAARLLHRMAGDLDDNVTRLMETHDDPDNRASPRARQNALHQAQISEAEASRLWYALTVFMEHTGLGPEDLDDTGPTERMKRAGRVKPRDD